jgi:hypothetical protein
MEQISRNQPLKQNEIPALRRNAKGIALNLDAAEVTIKEPQNIHLSTPRVHLAMPSQCTANNQP